MVFTSVIAQFEVVRVTLAPNLPKIEKDQNRSLQTDNQGVFYFDMTLNDRLDLRSKTYGDIGTNVKKVDFRKVLISGHASDVDVKPSYPKRNGEEALI
jgi:hypothetical protein